MFEIERRREAISESKVELKLKRQNAEIDNEN